MQIRDNEAAHHQAFQTAYNIGDPARMHSSRLDRAKVMPWRAVWARQMPAAELARRARPSCLPCADCVNLSAMPGIHVLAALRQERRRWPVIGERKRRRPLDGYARP